MKEQDQPLPEQLPVTSKAEERSIRNDNHVQPAGHLTVVKNVTNNNNTVSYFLGHPSPPPKFFSKLVCTLLLPKNIIF